MKRKRVPFSWQNVPRIFILFAAIISIVAVFGIINPSMFGDQNITFPIILIAAGVSWGIVYLLGRTPYPDEPPTAAEQETPAERASREFAESQPEFQDYLDAEQAMENEHPEIANRIRHHDIDSSHHYDERI